MSAYTIGPRSLRIVCPSLSKRRAEAVAKELGAGFHRFHITTPRRAAAAVAQMAHESDGFRTTHEYASGAAYEGRHDLGNFIPGDGVRYKGRGFIQITGRENYRKVSAALDVDFESRPERLETLHWAAIASCWWWEQRGLNRAADRWGTAAFIQITRAVNGGTNGLASRLAYWARAKAVARYLTPRAV